jgi:hypothetical protein
MSGAWRRFLRCEQPTRQDEGPRRPIDPRDAERRMEAIGSPVTREDFLRGIGKSDYPDPF